MKKIVSIVIWISIVLTILSGCTMQSLQKPTATLESTVTPQPTETPEPTTTPTQEYCNQVNYLTAREEILSIYDDLAKQVEIYIEMFNSSDDDYQDIIIEVSKLQRDISNLEVPDCMDYLKQTLEKAISDIATGVTFAQAKNLDSSMVEIVEATTQIGLFQDELSRLDNCQPNCEP